MRGAMLVLAILLATRPAAGQELGNKVLGAVGVNAGTQPEPGLYLLDRLIIYSADQLRDRNGNLIPIQSLEINATANMFGLSFTVKFADNPYFTAAIGAPLARVRVNADDPRIATDASGFGDLFVQPVKLGARFNHFDVVAAYVFYAPTGHFEPRRLSVGRGFWTHQFSAGGALYPDRKRTHRASLLASYDVNLRKHGIDITRGNIFQMQGGAGTRLAGPVDVGLAGFALWQVTNNRGSELPDVVRGAHTRAFGLGPEIAVTVPAIRARFDLRTEWEFGVRSRQDGWVLATSASFVACCPIAPRRPASKGPT